MAKYRLMSGTFVACSAVFVVVEALVEALVEAVIEVEVEIEVEGGKSGH